MSAPPRRRPLLWGSELCRPAPIAAILILGLNDHLGKVAPLFPAWVHGKLSDLAGLFFFPLLLFTLADLACGGLRRRAAAAWGCAGLTVLGFTLVKTWPLFQGFVSRYLGTIVLDPTDLVALPAAPLGIGWMLSRPDRRPAPAWARLVVMIAASVGSMATQAPRMHRQYPTWRIAADATVPLACSTMRVWVAKTGKTGMGLGVRVTGPAGCRLTIQEARFQVGGEEHAAAVLPPPFVPAGSPGAAGYLPFPFDGEQAWNRGQREGWLRLRLVEDDHPAREVALPLVYRLDAFHANRFDRSTP